MRTLCKVTIRKYPLFLPEKNCMKIFAVGRNYTEHIKELNNVVPDVPVIFMKPETALIKNNNPFYFPDFTKNIRYETEIVLKISKEGKHIQPKFSRKYFEEIGLGIDFTAVDVQEKLKQQGLPWETAKAFDGSAPVSDFVPVSRFQNLQDIRFSLKVNGEERQKGHTEQMIHSFEDIIAYISCFFTLKKGDLIFTGTPAGVGSVRIGDVLEAFIEDEKMLEVKIL